MLAGLRLDGVRVLVLDGEERASLAVVRSLVRAGCSVSVAARSRWSIAGASRGAQSLRLPIDALDEPERFAEAVAELVRRATAQVLIPVTDASLESVLSYRQLLPEGVVLPFAPLATYRAASDKVLVHRFATEAGVGVRECVVVSAGEAAPDDPLLYPGVVKPHRSIVGTSRRTKTGVRFVRDRAECARALAATAPEAFPVMVQGRVVGPGEGVFIARHDGQTIARFAHRRIREKPPAGGVSVYRESIMMEEEVLNACEQILDRLGWEGVAMVEGKRDLGTGGWRVMEINGRFWGSLQLAVDSGVDFPALLVSAAIKRPIPAPSDWRTGIRLRWEWGDIDHLLIRLRRSREYLGLPVDSPGRMRALSDFLTNRPGRDRLELLRLRDPMPFVVETLARFGVTR